MKHLLVLPLLAVMSLSSCGQDLGSTPIPVNETAPEQPTSTVKKTDEEWKAELTPEQYAVLRHEATEPPFRKVYKEFTNNGEGIYHCAGCGTALFDSATAFDSGTGWPSFWDIVSDDNVALKTDTKLGYERNEVVCGNCDGHLGHLFLGESYDNPKKNRYCINGTALTFTKK